MRVRSIVFSLDSTFGAAHTLLKLCFGALHFHRVPTQEEVCEDYLGTTITSQIGVILTADPGDFSGTSEAFHILANLKHKQVCEGSCCA